MSTQPTPIRRSVQLTPLSREHHDGLLFVWKIRQGIQHRVPLDRIRKYTLWFWKHHIKPHFFQEEKILVPMMPSRHPLSEKMLEEHDYIRELVLGLDQEADTRTLELLCNLLDAHIRFEEREFFKFLEEHLTTAQLDKVHQQLEAHPVNAKEKWDDEFWVKK